MNAFYLEPTLWHTQKLEDSEFRHAAQSLRLKKDDIFLLFDGEGRESECRVTEVQKKCLHFEIEKEQLHSKPEKDVVLALAWTKSARRSFLLEKVTELGASEIWFWYSQYSQFPLPEENSATVQTWQAQLIAGMKQCKNPFLPKIRLVPSQKELIELATSYPNFHVFTTENNAVPYTEKELSKKGSVVLVVGSEGGFSPSENELFTTSHAEFYSLGKRALRYETASALVLGLHFWHG